MAGLLVTSDSATPAEPDGLAAAARNGADVAMARPGPHAPLPAPPVVASPAAPTLGLRVPLLVVVVAVVTLYSPRHC